MDIGDTVFRYVINELGYRERPMPRDSCPSAQRVFVIGDSFTEGNGTEYHRSWTRYLEASVKTRLPKADFFVCGISGLDPHYAWAALSQQLMAYRPSHVITTVNDSDFDEQIIRGGYSRFKNGGSVKYLPAPWFLAVYRFSHIVRMIVHECYSYDYYLINRINQDHKRAEVADSIAQCLSDINQLCVENGIKFLTVIHPNPHKICYPQEGLASEVLALDSHNFHFPVVRMYEPLKNAMKGPDCSTYHWKTDSHFNGAGYNLFSSVLFLEIERDYPDFWHISIEAR